MKNLILWGTLLCSMTVSAQNAPPALSRNAANRYEETLANHPDKLGGQFRNSPTFVGGQAYSYEHCLKLTVWVNEHHVTTEEMSVIQLGNLWYTMDDGCQFIYGLYGDAELDLDFPRKRSRCPASNMTRIVLRWKPL